MIGFPGYLNTKKRAELTGRAGLGRAERRSGARAVTLWGGALRGTPYLSWVVAQLRATSRRLAGGWPIVQLPRIARRSRNSAPAASHIGKERLTRRHALPSVQVHQKIPY